MRRTRISLFKSRAPVRNHERVLWASFVLRCTLNSMRTVSISEEPADEAVSVRVVHNSLEAMKVIWKR